MRVLGEILERARPLTIFCNSQPLPLPKAPVHVIASDQFIAVRGRAEMSGWLRTHWAELFCGAGRDARRGGAGETEGVAEGEGLGGAGGAGLLEDGEEVAADGESDAGFGGLVVVSAGAEENELAVAAAEGFVACDFVGFGVLAVVGLGVGGGGWVEEDGVGFFDELCGAVVVEIVPGLGGPVGGDGEPGGELDAFGGGGRLAVVAVFKDARPVAEKGLLEV